MNPLVSCIIPTFNRAAFIRETVVSVLNQTYRPIEVVVVDDGSTDDTPRILAEFGDAIRYIRQDNAGLSGARNRAIAESRGPFIALLDDDDRWLPDKLEGQMPFFNDPGVGLAYAAFRCFRTEGDKTLYSHEHFAGEQADFHDLLRWTPLGTQTLVLRRDVLDEVGVFNSEMDGCEDHDLCLRVALKYQLRGLSRFGAEVRLHSQQVSLRRTMMYRSAMRVWEKYRHAHGDCELCRQAAAQSLQKHRLTYYRDLNQAARKAISSGRVLSAVGLAMKAVWIHPAALTRIPRKLLGKR